VLALLFVHYHYQVLVYVDTIRHVKWVPYHHGMAHPQVAIKGDGLQIWKVAANILNKQSQTADKGSPPAWGLEGG
jgi:hypothetical protein